MKNKDNNSEEMQNNSLEQLKNLSLLDRELLTYYFNVINCPEINNINEQKISSIAKAIGLPDTKDIQEEIEKSLNKINKINIYNNENTIYGQMLLCNIYSHNKYKYAKVSLGPILQEHSSNNNNLTIDRNSYYSLTFITRQIAIRLLARINEIKLKKNKKIDNLSYDYIKKMYIDADENIIDITLGCLEELKSKKILVKEYSYNKEKNGIKIQYI